MCSGQVISGESLGYWNATATTTEFPALVDEQDVDIAIVGRGIVGWCENDRELGLSLPWIALCP